MNLAPCALPLVASCFHEIAPRRFSFVGVGDLGMTGSLFSRPPAFFWGFFLTQVVLTSFHGKTFITVNVRFAPPQEADCVPSYLGDGFSFFRAL